MVIWIIGMSGAGKTAIGKKVYEAVKEKHKNTVLLDGDEFRAIFSDDLGHSLEDRRKNADRFCRTCKYLERQEIVVIGAILSIFPESRRWNRENYHEYFEVFLDVPLEELIRRDPKGLYRKALRREIKNMAGVDIPFPPPENADLIIKNDGSQTIEQVAGDIVNHVFQKLGK